MSALNEYADSVKAYAAVNDDLAGLKSSSDKAPLMSAVYERATKLVEGKASDAKTLRRRMPHTRANRRSS